MMEADDDESDDNNYDDEGDDTKNIFLCSNPCTYTSCHDHAAHLVHNQDIQLRWRRAEPLLKDLQDRLHHLGLVLQHHSQVTKCQDGVGGDQVRLPNV